MVKLAQVLKPARCLAGVEGISKKRVLEQCAQLLARDLPEIPRQSIFESLLAREKLGSTGFGGGIALPHCRLAGCTEPLGALLQLSKGVDFDALDGAPVDVLFVLLVPPAATDEHLELLRQIAALLSQSEFCAKLRRLTSGAELYRLVCEQGEQPCNSSS